MDGWTDGYVADIGYTHGFYREMTPAQMAFALLLRGYRAPDPAGPLDYCELGCGQGFGANLIAASSPEARFWATDFNPSHALNGARLAEAGGGGNIRFYDRSFAEFAAEDTPAFDVIALHGIYSWVSAENRRAIVDFISRKLKFGGLVYASYNTLPGWSSAMPLRELMIRHAAGTGGPTLSKIDRALAFTRQVAETKAAYFNDNPLAAKRLERLGDMPRNYLAHEYFNREFSPRYFADVAAELASARLAFAASAHIGDHVDALNLSAEAQKLLAEIGDPDFRETMRDYFVNQHFRRDIFVRGALRLSPLEQAEQVRRTRFVLTTPAAEIPLKAVTVMGEVNLQRDIYEPVIAALGGGATAFGDLLSSPGCAGIGQARLLQALTVLCALGHAAPALSAEGEAARRAATDRFNAAVCDRARFGDELGHLASPVTGSGVPANRFEQLFLLARRQGRDPAELAWSVLSAANQRLVKDGAALEGAEANLAELRSRDGQFEAAKLPVWRRLGVA
ncbi:MAG TPA: class I SAM-dependent methyltransferase [Alphaproteobacteria bacterium]|nr:class I SAM-dependent methyltransferase [Alphaproteobacteria bacterium]